MHVHIQVPIYLSRSCSNSVAYLYSHIESVHLLTSTRLLPEGHFALVLDDLSFRRNLSVKLLQSL